MIDTLAEAHAEDALSGFDALNAAANRAAEAFDAVTRAVDECQASQPKREAGPLRDRAGTVLHVGYRVDVDLSGRTARGTVVAVHGKRVDVLLDGAGTRKTISRRPGQVLVT